VLARYVHIDAIPDDARDWDEDLRRAVRSAPKLAERLAAERQAAVLFRVLATLRIDRSVLGNVDELEWRGPTPQFAAVADGLRENSMASRLDALSRR
jgi:hypothetical protein